MFAILATLPPGFYKQASCGKPLALETQHTGGSSSIGSPTRTSFGLPSNNGAIKPQYLNSPLKAQTTGTAPHPSPLHSQFTGSGRLSSSSPATSSPIPSTTTSMVPSSILSQLPWDISAQEKAKSDRFFDGLDTQHRGYIEGDVALPFTLGSRLSEEPLAKIWCVIHLTSTHGMRAVTHRIYMV